MSRVAPYLLVVALAAGCFPPEVEEPNPTDAGAPIVVAKPDAGGFSHQAQVVIQNYTFTPLELFVSPGDTIVFKNLDGDTHTVTSQTTPGTYQFGQVNGVWFDIPPFTGTWPWTVPADAPHGTVIYYFDRVCRDQMKNQPSITIR
ncbi:MAG: hypothetical protein QM765_42295 [Myxococcales bacterium]